MRIGSAQQFSDPGLVRRRQGQEGRTHRSPAASDLVPIIGSRSRVSEVLNRRRDLTVAMIVRIREKLGIPADVLSIQAHLRPRC